MCVRAGPTATRRRRVCVRRGRRAPPFTALFYSTRHATRSNEEHYSSLNNRPPAAKLFANVATAQHSAVGYRQRRILGAERYSTRSKWDVAAFSRGLAWRVRVVDGALHVKMLSMQPHWAERTSVLRLLLLSLRRHASRIGSVEGVDLVYVHNDRDPTPWRGWPPGSGSLIPLCTNAHDAGRSSLPLPEFSWAGWHTHTQPWCRLGPEVGLAGGRIPWSNRTDLALFSGGLDNGPMRKQLRLVAASDAAKGVIKVRNVAPRFFTTTAAAKAGKDPPQTMSSMCGYKYLISVAGYGYSNRLKSLLMCGSVVIHVRQPWNEFFMPVLQDNKHIAIARTVQDIIPVVHRLRQNASLAKRIARQGRAMALKELSMGRTLDYLFALLRGYSSIQRERATSTAGFTRATTAAALGKLAAQCDCGGGQTKPTAERCGVSRADFYSGPLRGKHRCCDGWDCPIEICPELTVPGAAGAPATATAANGDADGARRRLPEAPQRRRPTSSSASGARRASSQRARVASSSTSRSTRR